MKIWPVVAVLFVVVGCADTERSPIARGGDAEPSLCTDQDGDGYGDGCEYGDCNDEDPSIHKGCLSCTRPAEGCACDSTSKPVSCYLDPSFDNGGDVMCHEGTRYCRNGSWSGCESVFSYPKPPADTSAQAVVAADAGVEKCSDCRPNCFVIRDNLSPVDGGVGSSGNNTAIGDGGSLGLGTYIPDASITDASATWDAAKCMIGSAPDKDCDGIFDQYDPYPDKKPFSTSNPAIFMDLAPGATGTGSINLEFNLNSIDVYFMVDQTSTMAGERDKLIATLTKTPTGESYVTAGFDCADYDHDGKPNNELKGLGIAGAIRCYIRDANFGAGYFRELPFSTYADLDEVAFRNMHDISSNVDSVLTAINKLTTRANKDYDEDTMPAMYSLISGNGMYMGTDRMSVPTRTGCPAGTWGYPCFRQDAIPIVLLFTDAQTHNGPTGYTNSYTSGNLGFTKGNTDSTVTIVSGNETFTTGVIDAADLTSRYVSFQGDTTKMAADASANFMCGTTSSPDAFYKFTLSGASKPITISTEGSEIDTVLGVWKGLPTKPTATATNPSGNDAAGGAFSFGPVENAYQVATGSTSGLNADYLAVDLGCNAYPGSPDAAFTFSLTAPTKVALDTAGSTIGTSLSLFSGTPTQVTYEAGTVNTNDTLAAGSVKDILAINGLLKAYNGTTNNAAITANYNSTQLGCSPADNAPDAVYQFTVGGTTNRRIRISSGGSALHTVLNLTNTAGSSFSTPLTYASNDKESSNPSTILLDDKSYSINTNTGSGYNADYSGYDPAGACNASDRDAIYKFSLGSTKTVQIDTSNASFNTTLALFRSSITAASSTTTTSLASYDTLASAYAATVTNAKHVVNSSTTSAMAANYTAANVNTSTTSCNAVDGSQDAVYKLTFTGPTKLHLETSSASFDTVVSLHSSLPDSAAATAINSGDIVTGTGAPATGAGSVAYAVGDPSGKYQQFSNSTTGYQTNVQINGGSCTAADAAPDAVFSFSVPTGGGTYQIDTVGSTADTVLGIYKQADVALLTDLGHQGDKYDGDGVTYNSVVSKQVDLGDVSNKWKSWIGSYANLADDTNNLSSSAGDGSTSCGADRRGKDVYLKFSAPSTAAGHVLRIDTTGSTYFGVLGLYTAASTPAFVSCANTGSPGDVLTLTVPSGGGSWYVVLKGKSNGGGGDYKLTIRDTTAIPTVPAMQYCDDNGGGGTDSKIASAALTAGNYYAVVKGKTATSAGAFKIAFKDLTWANAQKTALVCNDNTNGTTTNSSIDYDVLAAGTYYVVVKGKSGANANGTYTLTMQDSNGTNGFIACNDDAIAGSTNSSLTQTLPAGTYYAMVKGNSSATTKSGTFTLNIADTAAPAMRVLACDYGTAAAGSSAIETDLAPGNYRVFVKGKNANEKDAYKLQVRDVTALPLGAGRVACDYQSGVGGKSYMETQLNAGTYTVLLNGDNASGNYRLSVRDADKLAAENSAYCDDDGGAFAGTSLLTPSLGAGTYYVGVKGKTATDLGQYQVHFGGGAFKSATYAPKTYADVVAEMTKKDANGVPRGAHVITMLSCYDDGNSTVKSDCPGARTQFEALANATNSLTGALKPAVFDIHADGSGLSTTVVDAVKSLAGYLAMDVGVRIVFDPDKNPSPPFTFTVKAKDSTGCSAPINEEFQDCIPGATPRFEVSFTNPLAAPVPLNPADPKGGYSFRAELLGDKQFIVDSVPIYIVPQAVVNVPIPQVYPTGTYSQTLAATGCSGKTDLPDWNELTWNATIPSGTSVSFSACGSASAADLATCTTVPLCTITGGAACNATTPCPSDSICSAGGTCWKITGNTCSDNTQCRTGSTCKSGACVYANQPIDVGELLGTMNHQPNLRVQIGLNANTTANVGPTVHDWQLNYLCKTTL